MSKKSTTSQLSTIPNVNKTTTYKNPNTSAPVNHPNFIPDGVKNNHQGEVTDFHTKTSEFDSSRGKPPIGTHNLVHGGETARNTRCLVNRSISHEGSRSEGSDVRVKGSAGSLGSGDVRVKGSVGSLGSGDFRVKGSVGSLGSGDSKNLYNEEEVVITYQDEAIDIDEQGAGNKTAVETTRLVLLSSKMRNTMAIRHALQPNVVLVQYKYDNSTLEGILGLVAKSLGEKKCESIAFILSCSGLSIQLCGKEEKTQVLTRENVTENSPVREFFLTLVSNHVDKTRPGVRLDFLACNLLLHTDGGSIDKEIESFVGVPVGLHKDLAGGEITKLPNDEGGRSTTVVGDLYFKLEKLRGWSGQQQQTLAGFEKIQTVGKGAYGAAVLYKKKDDDSLVILKEINMHDLNASERQMALNEVNILAMLEHPNIISYFDSFEEDGVIMIEMEYADGGTLTQFLASQEKPLEEREILAKFKQITDAIRHIHEHNVLHRDLKTANIFLTKEGVIKVGDFGISKMMSTANKGANTVLGTPYYISPEMCEGKPYKDKSDIWALGCILYEMACRQKTFEGSNLPALVNKIMKGQFAPVKGNYSQEFKDLIMMMLSQDPENRPSADDLVYVHIPKLEADYEEGTSDNEDESRPGSEYTKKKTRTILYYFDSATADLTPFELNPKVKIRTTAVGPDHLVVVTTESQVYTWGEGSNGQLGHGDMVTLEKPKLVEALTGKCIARACCGEGFSIFTSDRGIVLTCGDGSKGCLGHADFNNVNRPRLIESLLSVDVISVACGTEHVVVVGSEGEIFSWGNGTDGKLGLGSEENHSQPMRVTISEPVLIRDVFCGIDGTMFLTDVGSVLACGSNRDNKLALNNRHGFIAAMRNIFTRCEVEGQKVPTFVRSLARHRVINISMGRHHTSVIVGPGKVYTFGRNVEGQLGIEGTKSANAPVEVKSMTDNNIVRIQCGDHYTVASTDKNEIYYWGLRFKDPNSQLQEEQDSRSSVNDDMRIESVTPRHAGHSRQPSLSSEMEQVTPRNLQTQKSCDGDMKGEVKPEGSRQHNRHGSTTSGLSITSCKEGNEAGLTDREDFSSPQRQTSVDSSLSGLTDSGYTGDMSTGSEIATRTGFRPLSSLPRRSLSASSRENQKEKDKDADLPKDNSEIIFPPDHLMRIMPQEELLTLSSFFCHGENLFIQLETTAPPPRRKSRKKRGIRKRYSGTTLVVPAVSNNVTSASSREGGDEYSSEASEMDTQGTVPTWIKQELAMSEELDANDGNLPDDTSDVSDEDRMRGPMFDNSMSSIQINRDLTPCKLPPDKNLTPRNSGFLDPSSTSSKKSSPRDHRARSFSNNSTESEVENSNQSDSSTKDMHLRSEGRSKTMLVTNLSKVGRSIAVGARAKSASTKYSGGTRTRHPKGHNMVLKEQLAARGFVSDVTVKRREEALLGELHMTREEKILAERKVMELEQEYQRKQEQLRQEAEQRALEREKTLQDQISILQQQLQTQNSQLQDNQKTVQILQDQLSKVQTKKNKLTSSKGNTSESKVCSLQ